MYGCVMCSEGDLGHQMILWDLWNDSGTGTSFILESLALRDMEQGDLSGAERCPPIISQATLCYLMSSVRKNGKPVQEVRTVTLLVG